MYIYRTFVKKHTYEIVEKRNQDPDTIEELKSQLLYMNKSISTLDSTTRKNQGKTKLNILSIIVSSWMESSGISSNQSKNCNWNYTFHYF